VQGYKYTGGLLFMTLLEEFIFSLSKTERFKLRPLQFRGAKRKIFFKILDCRTRAGIDSEIITKRYRLTKKRYYAMLGEMLTACYHDIVEKNGTTLLLFLGNKQLFRHFYNEMRKQEAALIEKGKKKELRDYYFQVLTQRALFILNPVFNEELVKELDSYSARYVKIIGPHPENTLYLELCQIRKDIDNPHKGFNSEEMKQRISELEIIFEKVRYGDHILAQFLASDTLLMLLSRFYFAGKSPVPYAQFGIQLIRNNPAKFSLLKDFYELECLRFLPAEEGNTIDHIKHYLMESSKDFGTSIYSIGRFFQQILRNDGYEWATKYIENFFPYNIDLLRNDMALNYWYILTIFYSHTGNYSEGENSLRKAFASNTGKNRSINVQVILRCYEVFFIAMQGDVPFLKNMIDREIRYAHQHGYERGATFQIIFLKAIDDLTKYIGIDKDKAEKIRDTFLVTPQAERLSFLFEKIYDKYFQ
jgi:hypothetical protein